VNLRILRPSRQRLTAGDVFVMLPPEDRYLFGRVISTTAKWGANPSLTANLIYVFKVRSVAKTMPDRTELLSDRLLFAPVMTNRLPWSRGYFETITNLPLGEGEVLQQHCFRFSNHRCYDEHHRELSGPTEPCGEGGLHSFRTVDDLVSDALGIPLAPD